jgi:hypothetical protein
MAATEARVVPRKCDEVPDTHGSDAGPYRFDKPGTLVAQDDRNRSLPVAITDMQIRVADAGRGHPDEDLARAWLLDDELVDPSRRADSVKYGSTHAEILAASRAHIAGRPRCRVSQPGVTTSVPDIP